MINKLLTILIMCSLSLPVIAIEGQEAETTQNGSNLEIMTTQEIEELNNSTAPDINKITTPDMLPSRYKEPVSKKVLVKKFIIAMLCVVGTSIFLYGTLSIYNKLRDGFVINGNSSKEGEQPLDAPNDLTEAVKTFIEKTHWED